MNHFAYNFAKCSPILIILSPGNWVINLQCSKPIITQMLGSLITILISDCRQFFWFIFHKAVTQCSDVVEYLNRFFLANLPMSLSVKEFWKSVNICGSYGQEFTVFFDSRCSLLTITLNTDFFAQTMRRSQREMGILYDKCGVMFKDVSDCLCFECR